MKIPKQMVNLGSLFKLHQNGELTLKFTPMGQGGMVISRPNKYKGMTGAQLIGTDMEKPLKLLKDFNDDVGTGYKGKGLVRLPTGSVVPYRSAVAYYMGKKQGRLTKEKAMEAIKGLPQSMSAWQLA